MFNKASIKPGKVMFHGKPKNTSTASPDSSPAPASSSSSLPTTNPVLTPKRKLASEIFSKLRVKRAELIKDKGGVEITSDPKDTKGKVTFSIEELGKLFVVKFHIVNRGQRCIYFSDYTALHRMCCFTLVDESRVNRVCPLLLCPGEHYVVEVHYKVHHHGHFPATMYFEFCPESEPPETAKPFCIVRELEAVVQSQLAAQLGPESPYNPKQNRRLRPKNRIVEEGVPPESFVTHTLKSVVKLKEFKYPAYLKQLARQKLEDSEGLSPSVRQQLPRFRRVLEAQLCMKYYAERFQLLLHLEEIQMEVDIKKYDLHGQIMTRDKTNKKLLILKVPGVAENRPSVLRGDHVSVCVSADKNQPITVYKGYVHQVELERVKLGFSKNLLQRFLSNMKFDVEFNINCFPIKLQHRAVELAVQHGLGDVLFPSDNGNRSYTLPHLRMFNKDLEKNPEQKAAVQHIVSGTSKPAPYLIFGPPGTGKTVTLVEAIKQVNKSVANAHILACAPSNSACDLLCERLLGYVDAHRLYRLYAPSRDPHTVPQKLLKHSNLNEAQDSFLLLSREAMMNYTVIVVTLVTAGRLVSAGIAKGHFTHIFIDEAGQAVEPECIIGIAGLLDPVKGQLILAGDPQQLGPILRSPLAQLHGLGHSLLERLMKQNTLYQKIQDGHLKYDSRFVTKLLRNYRSHPAILKIPNELFYDNELQVFANQMEREEFCHWEHLPKKGFPVLFHGVIGKDEREANSPSFFNVTEIVVIVSYLNKLMQTQGKKGLPKLTANDIGIIAPYRKQVEKVQKALNTVAELSKWKDIKVGSVEEFQGQERKVIIVSTVRSSINYVKMDKDFNIGFLSNEKRFNVAMTRAKALLIVVGNPVILSKDPTWQRFIHYCEHEQGCTGFDFKDAEGEEDVVNRLASLTITSDELTDNDLRELSLAPYAAIPTSMDLSDANSASESDIETNLPEPLTSVYDKQLRGLPPHVLKEKSLEMFQRLRKKLTLDQCETLELTTREQSKCRAWHTHREGRITSTNFHLLCTAAEPTDNDIKNIMHYNKTEDLQVPAVLWGREKEATARKDYIEQTSKGHANFFARLSGLVVHPDYLYLGASPDGIVSCSCCGRGTLEIKCPYKYREGLNRCNEDPQFCLDTTWQLKRNHPYYYQVQLQIFVCDVQYSDFVVWTKQDMVINRIERDEDLLQRALPKAEQLFLGHLLPELLTRSMDPCLIDEHTLYCPDCNRPDYAR
ncbi:putative helicase mov-10-B.1 isoform X2 [Myxocyprinus asiaticus]|uniref:putative helicase mov-10-B.1 isoform X2 n=1 Tax=Myxocyprinus asiaticus TaxID=70543 RepID=UPI0022235558|nr:putative helicase mov-10-B.1 isoform X2 [Myxocyprinus asiaticus]XP_051562487.1 putative helicase mov-10-B.1 isoform X2 [Myxocyprinus asiaticus]